MTTNTPSQTGRTVKDLKYICLVTHSQT